MLTCVALTLEVVMSAPAPIADSSYLVWDVAPLGIDVRTADLLRDMLVLELGKMLGERLVTAHREITPGVRQEVDDCGRTSACFAEIGGAIGVDRVIFGVASTLGDAYSLNLKMVDVHTGEAFARAQASIQGERDKMLAAIQTLVFDLLDPALLNGALAVDIGMDGVSVFVDGHMVGTTPVGAPIEGLAAGEHTLKLSSPTMRDYFTFFNVQVGKTTRLRVDPEQIAALRAEIAAVEVPLYKRWWFWAIIGGVAASAAGGTLAAVTAQGRGSGMPATSLGTVDLTGR
jgi:hypothetical protein